MTDGEEKMIELMSLMLDELRGVKQEVRGMKKEQETTNIRLANLEIMQQTTNIRLGAIEYILGHENPEFRNRIELLENRVGRLESR